LIRFVEIPFLRYAIQNKNCVNSLFHMSNKKLSHLLPGESCRVLGLSESSLRPKLAEMGLLRGRKLLVLFQAPFHGPIAVDVEGYILSLRMEEAAIVEVETEHHHDQ
jgi:ferrous iron transport protein A